MKRFVSILLAMALTLVCALAAVSCGDSSSSGKTKIAIVQPMDHTSLNQIRDTIISTLKDLGYDDSNSEIILKNASNDASLLPSIFSSLVSENVDIIIPIGTGAALGAVSHFWPKKKVVVTADGRTVKTCDDGGACCCH